MPQRSFTGRGRLIGCACRTQWIGGPPQLKIRRRERTSTTTSKPRPKEKEEITLEILDSAGDLVKSYSNLKKEEVSGPSEWPDVQRTIETLPAEEGLNHFGWNSGMRNP
jgi:hypothetical protein